MQKSPNPKSKIHKTTQNSLGKQDLGKSDKSEQQCSKGQAGLNPPVDNETQVRHRWDRWGWLKIKPAEAETVEWRQTELNQQLDGTQ